MKRSTLTPEFETVMRALLQRSGSRTAKPLAVAAPHDVAQLLEEHDPTQISRISGEMRHVLAKLLWELYGNCGLSYDAGRLENSRAAQKAAQQIDTILAASPEAAIAFTVAYSGYSRETALKSLTEIRGPFGLVLVLQRINDWVPEVAKAARLELDSFISVGDDSGLTLDTIMACLDLLLDEKRFGRMGESERLAVAKLLQYPGVENGLHHLLMHHSSDRYAPRYLAHGLRAGMFGGILTELASRAAHSRVRSIALHALLRGHYRWKEGRRLHSHDVDVRRDQDELAARALDDPSIEVQRVALQYIIETPASRNYSDATFRRFLHHRNRGLVERAVFGLESLGADIIAELRHELASECPRESAAPLLGRYGTKDDGVLIYEARARFPLKNRLAVLAAAAILGNDAAIDELHQIALYGADVREAKCASLALRKTGRSFSFEEIWFVIANAGQVIERGLLPFARTLPAPQLARLIVAMVHANVDCNYHTLWGWVKRKGINGVFCRDDIELNKLFMEVGYNPILASAAESALGFKLVRRP